jgi:phosphomannomutase
MISVAGIRGIVGETLKAEDFVTYALGFGTMVGGGKVVVGRDTRPSGEMIRDLVCGALVSTGCKVVDLGIVPTPTIGVMVRALRARGGVAITASHNPLEWNALKFFRSDGTLQGTNDQAQLLEICRSGQFQRARIARRGRVEFYDLPEIYHLQRVQHNVDARAIRRRKFRVVVDCCNGAGVNVIAGLLFGLGCDSTMLFENMDKAFERPAEPLPENLAALCERVVRKKADLGFALDPDADRLAIVDENGKPLGEERTLTLAAYHVLGRRRSPLVANLSTTRAIDDVAQARGVRVYRTAVGEAYVVEGMRQHRALIGGEGNGGVIWPKVHFGRDAASGIGLILEALAQAGETISQFNRRVPDYVMMKKRLSVEPKNLKAVFSRLEKKFGRMGRIWRSDGLRIDLPRGWFHLRPSGTEPIVRLFVEAPTAEEAEVLAAEVAELF